MVLESLFISSLPPPGAENILAFGFKTEPMAVDLSILVLLTIGIPTESVRTAALDFALDFFISALVRAPCMLSFDVACVGKGDCRLS